MDVRKVLDRISDIRDHLVKTEVYRGYRALTVAMTGVTAVFGAAMQPRIVAADRPERFVYYWVSIAGLNVILFASEMLYRYVRHETEFEKHHTRRALGQFFPCLLVGLLITVGILPVGMEGIRLLPGLWAFAFGLGIFASRPLLPHVTGWVALYYVTAGAVLLSMATRGSSLTPWGMGVTFGLGQLLCALVFYWNIERNEVISNERN